MPACRTAGLAGLGFHDLRRTNATLLVASGVSVRDAQELLGHDDPRMLLGIYARLTAAGKRTAVDRIGEASWRTPATAAAASRTPTDVPWMCHGRPVGWAEPWPGASGPPALRRTSAGGGEGNRTPGLNSAIVALCQLSYTPAGIAQDSGHTARRPDRSGQRSAPPSARFSDRNELRTAARQGVRRRRSRRTDAPTAAPRCDGAWPASRCTRPGRPGTRRTRYGRSARRVRSPRSRSRRRPSRG